MLKVIPRDNRRIPSKQPLTFPNKITENYTHIPWGVPKLNDNIYKLNSSSNIILKRHEGYACGYNRTIYKTTNNGDIWNLLNTDSIPWGSDLNTAVFFDGFNGFVASNGHQWRTNDGGVNWLPDTATGWKSYKLKSS